MTTPAVPIAAAPPDAKPPAGEQIKDRRHRGFWAAAERTGNTVFLFFLNPVLDPDNNRVSGTRLLAWIVTWTNTFDVIHNHSLQELRLRSAATPIDALDWHNVGCYALALLIWYGDRGMKWGVDLVTAWKGRSSSPGGSAT